MEKVSSCPTTGEVVPATGASPVIASRVHSEETTENDYFNRRFIFATLERNSGELKFKECSVRSALESTTPEVTVLDHPFAGERHTSVKMVGSCNGLICVVLAGEIFLWNPCLGKSKKLPSFGVITETSPHNSFKVSYGFGYDSSTDDHKVVEVSCDSYLDCSYQTLAKIYSTKTNSWKMMENFNYCIKDNWVYFVNGKLHWTARRGAGVRQFAADQEIITLDMKTERCGKLKQPNYGGALYCFTLGLLGGCLSLSAYSRSGFMDIWVMEEYGVQKSWTKLFTVPHNISEKVTFMKPVFGSKEGRFAFLYAEYDSHRPTMALWDRKNDSTMEPAITSMENLAGVEVYVKSSVWPFPHEAEKKRRIN